MTNYYECARDIVHAPCAGGDDHTLCGVTADTILEDVSDFDPNRECDWVIQMVETEKRITCPVCAAIIRHCIKLGKKAIARGVKE